MKRFLVSSQIFENCNKRIKCFEISGRLPNGYVFKENFANQNVTSAFFGGYKINQSIEAENVSHQNINLRVKDG